MGIVRNESIVVGRVLALLTDGLIVGCRVKSNGDLNLGSPEPMKCSIEGLQKAVSKSTGHDRVAALMKLTESAGGFGRILLHAGEQLPGHSLGLRQLSVSNKHGRRGLAALSFFGSKLFLSQNPQMEHLATCRICTYPR
jgi:hypothetical protein